MKKIFFASILFWSVTLHAQRITPEEYIATFKEAAIAEMKRSGVPASITLSQGILETESGNSELVKKSNNHFGIKCKKEWAGQSVRHTDDAPNECFRKYNSAAESYKDHSDYLKNTPRYAALFELPISDYKSWAYGLKKAGYATNPRYPQIVISNIEKYNLQNFDLPQDDYNAQATMVVNKNYENEIPVTPIKATPLAIDADLATEIKASNKFNGLKAIFASKGLSLLAIATAADIPLQKLLDYNDMQQDGLLRDDQLIYLERKNKTGNRPEYKAAQNEKLYDVAQNSGVQLKALALLNNINENAIIPKGAKVKLK